jgi:hypothetical protein
MSPRILLAFWNARANTVLLVQPGASRLEILDLRSQRTVSVLHTLHRTLPVTTQDREAWFDALRRANPSAFAGRLSERTRFAVERPAVTAALFDDRGRIWLAGFDPASRGRHISRTWDVFALDGRSFRHVRFPEQFRLLRVQSGIAWGLLETRAAPLWGSVVQAYRIDER